MEDFAAEYVRGLSAGASALTLALSGELGAGKTSFVRGIARALGVSGAVTSPTYVIQNIYALPRGAFSRLVHIDAYRLLGDDELRKIGWNECMRDGSALVCIEWPERVSGCIPPDARRLSFFTGDGERRTIRYD